MITQNLTLSYAKSYYPINIQYVNDYKVKITFGFPLMSNSPTAIKIYVQEITASLTLLSSAPQDPTHSATANGGILFPARNPPSISNVGGCWLSLN